MLLLVGGGRDLLEPREVWAIGFIAGIILTLIIAVIGLGLPDVRGVRISPRTMTILQSKSMFAIVMTFLISTIIYGFVEESHVYSGFIDGVSTFLLISNYASLVLAGYRIEFVLPAFLALSKSEESMLAFDWGQVALLTLVLKHRKTLTSILLRRTRSSKEHS